MYTNTHVCTHDWGCRQEHWWGGDQGLLRGQYELDSLRGSVCGGGSRTQHPVSHPGTPQRPVALPGHTASSGKGGHGGSIVGLMPPPTEPALPLKQPCASSLRWAFGTHTAPHKPWTPAGSSCVPSAFLGTPHSTTGPGPRVWGASLGPRRMWGWTHRALCQRGPSCPASHPCVARDPWRRLILIQKRCPVILCD